MSRRADLTPGHLGVSRPDRMREGTGGWGVGSRPAGVTGLGVNTRDSPPCASSPKLEFQFSFGPWRSTPVPDTPCGSRGLCFPGPAAVMLTVYRRPILCQPAF